MGSTKDVAGFMGKHHTITGSTTASPHNSPVDRLPEELLEPIFGHSVESGEFHNSLDTRESPWLISHVCSRWRRIALGTPILWSSMSIQFSSLPSDDDEESSNGEEDWDDPDMSYFERGVIAYMDLLQLMLERSKDLPLKIFLDFTDVDWDAQDPSDLHEQLSKLISPHSNRISDLHVNGVQELNRIVMNSETPWNLSTLRHLDARLEDEDEDVERAYYSPPFHLFSSATGLMTAKFLYFIPLNDEMPWSQLRHLDLTISRVLLLDLHPILPSFTDLRKFCIWIMDEEDSEPDEFDPNDFKPVDLPSLEELYADSALPIQLITAPKLRHFIPPHRYEGNLTVEAVILFLHRSKCPVTQMFLRCFDLSAAEILQLLNAAPELLVFSWSITDSNSPVIEEVADALAIQDERGWFTYCPKLRDLDLSEVNPLLFIDMIERRWSGGGPGSRAAKSGTYFDYEASMRKVKLRFAEELWLQELQCRQDIGKRVKRLREEGLNISSKYLARGTYSLVEVW